MSDRSEWRRVRCDRPCPICKQCDWCLLAVDGSVAICAWTESAKRCGEAGWLHRPAMTVGVCRGAECGRSRWPRQAAGTTLWRGTAAVGHSARKDLHRTVPPSRPAGELQGTGGFGTVGAVGTVYCLLNLNLFNPIRRCRCSVPAKGRAAILDFN